jgi:hypothetical protein
VPTTRRGFLGTALGSTVAALARPFAARAQTTPAPPSATPTPAPPDPKAELLAKLARERYGKFLTAEELTMLDERIAAVERRSARLRAVKLSNGDEPATEFRARRG